MDNKDNNETPYSLIGVDGDVPVPFIQFKPKALSAKKKKKNFIFFFFKSDTEKYKKVFIMAIVA